MDPAYSFSYNARSISTVSQNGLAAGKDITGLLYTPDLDIHDRCFNITRPYVLNATRQGSLPNEDYNLIALAPWVSPECTLSFLQSAYSDPTNGFLFYVPNNSTDTPPGASDPQWDLGDSGAWRTTYQFPVFAIPGPVGALLMHESQQYSGNLTSVPYGNILAQSNDPRDYVRLFVDIGIASSSNLPSLWVFLLIVLGVLFAIILAASITMHCAQRRRRQSLRRRVVRGEVNLEALGIQRLTVPQNLLDEMPLFEYGSGKALKEEEAKSREAMLKTEHDAAATATHAASPSSVDHPTSPSASTGPTPSGRPNFENHVNQSTCAICLDDFVAPTADTPGSAVRQLPCHHIFHPECVDNFLRENSSLCPMCKNSALPVGYCPRNITNAMVRRERIIRRMRERADAGETSDELYSTRPVGFAPMRRLRNLFPRRRAPTSSEHAMADVTSTPDPAPPSAACPPDAGPTATPANRREWARQRALAMLGRQPLVAEEETEHRSRWRKVLGGVFPGVA